MNSKMTITKRKHKKRKEGRKKIAALLRENATKRTRDSWAENGTIPPYRD